MYSFKTEKQQNVLPQSVINCKWVQIIKKSRWNIYLISNLCNPLPPCDVYTQCALEFWNILLHRLIFFNEKCWYCLLLLSALYRRRQFSNLRYAWSHDVRQQYESSGSHFIELRCLAYKKCAAFWIFNTLVPSPNTWYCVTVN